MTSDQESSQLSFATRMAVKMKEYESQVDSYLPKELPFLIRIDGHNFSKFTKFWKKPFDMRFHRAMVLTTQDLVEEFQAVTGFTQSDEISLIFVACSEKRQHPYGGRAVKLISLTSAFATVRFSFHLLKAIRENSFDFQTEAKLIEKIEEGKAYFDSRVFSVPSLHEVAENIYWRSMIDGRRNSVSSLSLAHFPHKAIQGLSAKKMIEKLQNEKGVDWSELESEFKFGTIVKKELIMKQSWNPQQNKKVSVLRPHIVSKSFSLSLETIKDFALQKYWNSNELESDLLDDSSSVPLPSAPPSDSSNFSPSTIPT